MKILFIGLLLLTSLSGRDFDDDDDFETTEDLFEAGPNTHIIENFRDIENALQSLSLSLLYIYHPENKKSQEFAATLTSF